MTIRTRLQRDAPAFVAHGPSRRHHRLRWFGVFLPSQVLMTISAPAFDAAADFEPDPQSARNGSRTRSSTDSVRCRAKLIGGRRRRVCGVGPKPTANKPAIRKVAMRIAPAYAHVLPLATACRSHSAPRRHRPHCGHGERRRAVKPACKSGVETCNHRPCAAVPFPASTQPDLEQTRKQRGDAEKAEEPGHVGDCRQHDR